MATLHVQTRDMGDHHATISIHLLSPCSALSGAGGMGSPNRAAEQFTLPSTTRSPDQEKRPQDLCDSFTCVSCMVPVGSLTSVAHFAKALAKVSLFATKSAILFILGADLPAGSLWPT